MVVVNRLAAHFPSRRADADWQVVLEDYYTGLAEYPKHQVLTAVEKCICECAFFPPLATILEKLPKLKGAGETGAARERDKITDADWLNRVGEKRFRERYEEVHGEPPPEWSMSALINASERLYGPLSWDPAEDEKVRLAEMAAKGRAICDGWREKLELPANANAGEVYLAAREAGLVKIGCKSLTEAIAPKKYPDYVGAATPEVRPDPFARQQTDEERARSLARAQELMGRARSDDPCEARGGASQEPAREGKPKDWRENDLTRATDD